jgi:hypothetical protein
VLREEGEHPHRDHHRHQEAQQSDARPRAHPKTTVLFW